MVIGILPNATSQVKLPLGKIPMGSCRLGKYPWEVASCENTHGKLPFGKIPMGSCRLGKYPWEAAAWENTHGKLPLGKILKFVYFENWTSLKVTIGLIQGWKTPIFQ